MDPLSWLYARQGRFAPGLERIRALLARLGNLTEFDGDLLQAASRGERGRSSFVTGG